MKNLIPLYGCEPIGLGAPMVESLTSFVGRLCIARHLMPSAICSELIEPFLPKKFKEWGFRGGRLYGAHGATLDGHSELTESFVGAVSRLTGRDDLWLHTLLPWHRLFSRQFGGVLSREHRRWCACCLAEWRESGVELWEPLLWRVTSVWRCPVHRTPLSNRCPGCDAFQGITPGVFPFGTCRRCGRDLEIGDRLRGRQARDLRRSGARSEFQVSQVISRFLTAQVEMAEHASPRGFVTLLERMRRRSDVGSTVALSRYVRVQDSVVSIWLKGGGNWQFNSFLHVCMRIGVDPLAVAVYPHRDFLIPKELKKPRSNRAPCLRVRKAALYGSAPCRRWDSSDWERVGKELGHMLRNPEAGRVPITRIVRSLGVSSSTLQKRFPKEYEQFKELHAAYCKRRQRERFEKFEKMILRGLAECVEWGFHPTWDRIFELANVPRNLSMNQEYRRIIRAIMYEYHRGEDESPRPL